MATTKGDESKHSVDNPQAATHPSGIAPVEASQDEKDAQAASAARRAKNMAPKQVEPELSHGVDAVTGEEKDVPEVSSGNPVPVMVPESKGTIENDVTWPQHVQAPPVEQVAGSLNKSNSSTSQRVRAARASARK